MVMLNSCLATSFSHIDGLIGLDKHDIHEQLIRKQTFPCSGVQTKQTFWIILLHLFSFKFRHFLSTVGFSNEDNCCQLQGIGKLIKEKLSQGIIKVD